MKLIFLSFGNKGIKFYMDISNMIVMGLNVYKKSSVFCKFAVK